MTVHLPPLVAAAPADARRARMRMRMRMRWWLTLTVVLVVLSGAFAGWFRATEASEAPTVPHVAVTDTAARAPAGARIRVRVLNTTASRGLARRVTFVLRDFGYDVVDFDSDTRTPSTGTVILAHTGRVEWSRRLRRALGTGTIEQRADSLRYVDFTVLVGSDWKTPAQPFRP